MSAPTGRYAPDYASYNWTGAPANFTFTTNSDLGGDSRWRSGVHNRRLSDGHGHDSRAGLPLLRPGAAKISAQYDLGMYGFHVCRDFPVVLLGVLVGLLPDRDEWVYWQSKQLWAHENTRGSESRLAVDTWAAVCFKSGV
ncbi:hypothetical protein RJZ57_000809 [Blastomyces gilchristii]